MGPLTVWLLAGLSSPGFAFPIPTPSPSPSPLIEVSEADLPILTPDGDLAAFTTALERQLGTCPKPDAGWCHDTVSAFLQIARSSSSFADVIARMRGKFRWFKSTGDDGKGGVLFTGYDFPTLHGSLRPSAKYRYPVYSKPQDLVETTEGWRKKGKDGKLSAFDDREAIDFGGALSGQGLEIAYADDYLDVFGLQVEGSGVILLEDGTRQVVDFSAENGLKYKSLRHILTDQGVTDPQYLTWPGIRKYFGLHPEDLKPSVIQNPSYVFFRKSADGPFGTDGALLVGGHSIAIDPRVFPMGAVSFFSTQRPIQDPSGNIQWKDFSRLAVAQDTGGAINGPGHIDIYWGEGPDAELAAGLLDNRGTLYFALLKSSEGTQSQTGQKAKSPSAEAIVP